MFQRQAGSYSITVGVSAVFRQDPAPGSPVLPPAWFDHHILPLSARVVGLVALGEARGSLYLLLITSRIDDALVPAPSFVFHLKTKCLLFLRETYNLKSLVFERLLTQLPSPARHPELRTASSCHWPLPLWSLLLPVC